MRADFLRTLGEAISNVKAKGGVSHKSVMSDPHIQKAIDYIVKHTKVSKADVEQEIQEEMDKMADLKVKSPILYSAIVDNAPEQIVRRFFREKKIPTPKGAAQFDPVTFYALVRRVKAENPSIFPLRNFYNKKPLAAPRIILVPSTDPQDKKWNSVDTAAATPNGEFIFNVNCMQDDMNLAYTQGIKPKSKKYESNGGTFPDEWAPVEFTILHEFYHYTHGDFHMQKVLGGNPAIHNWAMDFRSNYDLMKSGNHPYAEGLYNDFVNYDNFGTYKEMYEAVKKEFEKLNKDQQKKVQQAMGGDDHSQHHGDAEPTTGETPSAEDAEKHGKGVSKKAGEREDGAKPEQAGDGGKPQAKADSGGRGGRDALAPTGVDWSSIKPRFNWKDLLAKLVRSSDTTEVTYQKVHKRNITSVHVATQTGAGVIRPGEKEVPSNLVKLCIVIDSSGSMHEAIKTVFANLFKLFNENQSAIAKQFALIEFSGDFHIYNCRLSGKTGSAHQITGVEGMQGAGGGERIDLSALLGRHGGGSTNFDEPLAEKIKGFLAKKYNVLIMTDTDIMASDNREVFMDLYGGHHSQVYMLLDSRESFTRVVQSMKQASANISHL